MHSTVPTPRLLCDALQSSGDEEEAARLRREYRDMTRWQVAMATKRVITDARRSSV
jgi:hypothetical protein